MIAFGGLVGGPAAAPALFAAANGFFTASQGFSLASAIVLAISACITDHDQNACDAAFALAILSDID